MAVTTIKISALPAGNSIDGINDYLPIVQSGVTNRINRATFLGITGAPVGTTDSQVLSSKIIGITNTVTVLDSLFTIQDNGDNTKQVQFQLSGITTGNTRTLTVPNASVTLASLTGTETFINKTITSATITGGTIDNATITVDSIAGHTSGTIVTVANMQISNGVINSANAVTATSIAAGAVQPQALVAGTGSGWTWQSWTPTFTNFTLGNGTLTAKYIQDGKSVLYSLAIVLGSTSAVSGSVTFTLPVTASATEVIPINVGQASYSIGSTYQGTVVLQSTTVALLGVYTVAGALIVTGVLSATNPGTFTTSSQIQAKGFYQAA